MVKLSPQNSIAVAFAIQMLVGAVLFLLVSGIAVGLNMIVHTWERHGVVPSWLSTAFPFVEMMVWAVDMLFYGIFLVVEFVRMVRRLLGGKEEI